MAQNRSICNGVARAAYACSLAVHCGLALGLQAHPLAHTNPFFACAPPFAGSDLEL